MKKISVLDVIVFLFAILFVYAAASKLFIYKEFEANLGKSPLIYSHAAWLAWAVPAIEIVISFALFIPQLQLVALYASFFLMFLFTGYIAFIITLSPYVPCSCGGVLSSLGWTEHLIFNVGFTLLAVIGIVLWNRQQKNKRFIEPSYS